MVRTNRKGLSNSKASGAVKAPASEPEDLDGPPVEDASTAEALDPPAEPAPDEKASRKEAMSDYQKRLDAVLALKTMTDCPCWQAFHSRIQKDIAGHGMAVLDAEKPRDVVKHQEGVKILKEIISGVRAPVDALTELVNEMPLYSNGMRTRAAWNVALGRVMITEIP
jgi:hypothetical protein